MDAGADDTNKIAKKRVKNKHSFFFKWKSWVLGNYEHFVPSLTKTSEIMSEASKVRNDFPCDLHPVLLGKIVFELWREKVKLVKRGPRNERRKGYLNLRRKVINEASQETFEEFMKSEIKLEGGWIKISECPNSISFIHVESWSFNNHRVTTEIRLTQLSPCELRYALISHGCEIDLANIIDIKTVERYRLSDRIKLILLFIETSPLCRGASIEEGETSINNDVVKYVDFTDGAKEETKVFSHNCFIIRHVVNNCCLNCRKVKRNCAQAKKRRLSRDEIHPKTNKRFMSKDEIAQQLRREKRQKKIHVEKHETDQSD